MKLPIMRKRKYDNWNNKTLFYTGANPVVERVLCFYGFKRTTKSLICRGYWKKTRRESSP